MAEQREGFWARIGKDETEPPWSLYDAGLVLIVLAVSLLLIGTGIATTLSDETLAVPRTQEFMIGWLVGLVIAGGFVLVRWRSKPEQMVALQLDAGRFPAYLMLLVGVALVFTVDLIVGLLSGQFTHPVLFSLNPSTRNIAVGMVFVGLIQPIVESLIFFGVLLPRLRATLGAYPGLVTTALLLAAYTALVYGAQLSQNLLFTYGFLFPFLVGLGLSLVRVWSQSTRATMIAYVGVGVVSVAIFAFI